MKIMMVKLKLFISLFICFILLFFISANIYAGSTFKYVWNNTTINVPLYDSIDKYKNIPKATLYKDGVALSDANVTYNTEGDWLYYMKNVDTTKIGEYKVWYKAYDNVYLPGTCIDYKCLITFIVRDNEAPKLNIVKDELYILKGSTFDLIGNIKVTDNYTKDISVSFNHNINFNQKGTYDVDVLAWDESENYVEGKFKVIIYENERYPVISLDGATNEISIPLGEDYDIRKFFKAYDSIDGDITSDIILPIVDNKTIGKAEYLATVTNSSGYSIDFPFIINVIDEEEPVLILTNHQVILDYSLDFSTFDYMKYIKQLSDNVDINYDNLIITHNLENKVGQYVINYEYSDGIYTVYDSINVSLVSYQAPKIRISDIKIKESENINLLDYVTVIDPSDEYINESIVINDDNVNYDKEGTYYATIYCINSSGLSSEAKFKVLVTSDSWFSNANLGLSISFFLVLGLLIISTIIIIIFINKRRKIKED